MLKYGGDGEFPSDIAAAGLKLCDRDTTLAVIWPFGSEPSCSCDRMFETVGKQDVRETHTISGSWTKGMWYSTPK